MRERTMVRESVGKRCGPPRCGSRGSVARTASVLAALLLGVVVVADTAAQSLGGTAGQTPATAAKEAYAYVVFPTIGKAGFVFGGSRGTGLVFEGGKVVGDAKVTQASFGLQARYESYSELVFFKDKATFESFKSGKIKMSAQASAVAVKEGAAVKTSYNDGVAVFVKAKAGLILDASVGGQKFTFEPKQ